MISLLLLAAYLPPAEWLIINNDSPDSLCNYLGLKFEEEYLPLMIYSKLAYKNDKQIIFKKNMSRQDSSKYIFNQFIVDYCIPVELSEATHIKAHKQKKLWYLGVGNFLFYNSHFTVC